ncbi:LysM peptidoglycan-binding domain-containing protein [Akkermansiaceae bacterium]|jgi:LysM repeat protein|nr:LysM peptidoglycan-binding domain-containing protein [Verrucomicrobiota bacterium]MDA7499358.1 LysM peptidoglycan-binding domain-containing protein [Akkermansiaceae bacterium]MDA7516468.1 LysM peptidoglycan-binding domain-containing protein [bacterium]MBT7214516.1 LysM peptidoglycan-binding domain-containing protein [Verrucomicrobiota bacterium]MDA7499602.1 LysM peptidoglycan-binding domain-containing protein [Akkermansiaceae bacterium]
MTCFILTTWFIAALSLPSLGQTQASLHYRISSKERQLAEIQKELHELRSRLSSPTVGKYSVRQGETLHSIARRNGVSVSSIIKWNKITDPAKLKVGEKIIISELLHSPISVPSPDRISSAGSADYVIASGDTFYSIARRHKMDLSELRALNPNVNIHLLSPGKKLRVSGETPLDSRPAKRQEVLVAEKDVKSKIDQPALESPTRAEALKSIVASKNRPQPPMIEDRNISSTTTSIILTDVITFEAFASRHNTNTKLLNALNGWNLPRTTILAGGSEILVPN